MERRKNKILKTKVCERETESPEERGRPIVRWKDRVKEEDIHERSADIRGRSVWIGRLFCRGHPLGWRSKETTCERLCNIIKKDT